MWLNLCDLPYFRALLRAVEARVYQNYMLPGPVLDLGCGDGHFASIAFDNPLDVGIDPWRGPLREAIKRGSYRYTIEGSGDYLPFANDSFSSAISNSLLEHIPDIDAVLRDLARVLKPGAVFIFCVPNHNFLANLSISSFFDRLGLRVIADAYRAFFNRISRHQHCDPPNVWEDRLGKAGYIVDCWWHYFSPGALHTLEWGHYFGLPSLVVQKLFGRWILAPYWWNLGITERIVQRYYNEEMEQPDGAYTFYVTRLNKA